jgi:hypothetical protein
VVNQACVHATRWWHGCAAWGAWRNPRMCFTARFNPVTAAFCRKAPMASLEPGGHPSDTKLYARVRDTMQRAHVYIHDKQLHNKACITDNN